MKEPEEDEEEQRQLIDATGKPGRVRGANDEVEVEEERHVSKDRNQDTKWDAPWLVLAVVAHMGWGLYAVFARYLQKQAAFPLGALQLLVMVNTVCLVFLIVFYTIPVRIWNWYRECPMHQELHEREDWRARVRYMLVFSMLLALRASTNVYAARLIPAFWSQLVQMFTPMSVSFLSYLAFGKELPPRLIPTVMMTLIGSVMTVVGGSMDSEVTERESISGVQIIGGITSALVSTLALSCYMVLVQKTKNLLSQEELLFNTFITIIVVLFPTSLIAAGWHWEAFTELAPKDWAMLFSFAILIYVGANSLAQLVIRHIGATLSVMFFGTRLISAVVGSYIILNEAINTVLEGAGLVLVGVTVTTYLVYQVVRTTREKKQSIAIELQNDYNMKAEERNCTDFSYSEQVSLQPFHLPE